MIPIKISRSPSSKVRLDKEAQLTYRDSGGRPDPEELAILLAAHDVIIAGALEKFDHRCFSMFGRNALGQKKKLIALMARGTDSVNLELAVKHGVDTVTAGTLNAGATAEHTMALILGLAKRLKTAEEQLRANAGWQWRTLKEPFELSGKTLGVIGAGPIARKVMGLALGFGMDVLCHTAHPDNHRHQHGMEAVSFVCLDTLVSQSHVITLHLPLVPETRNLIDAGRFKQMMPGALFINTSRGELVDETALCDALDSGKIMGAGIDVYQDEPQINPRFTTVPASRVILTPHSASQTLEAKYAMENYLTDQIIQWVCNEKNSV
ncbi:NAD(P)-dependent oxidoreductase [uncultured Desulfobacter sp.]|uniref:2-hydroxyacid dehydrogenase n=1 Tax=uncultured Desulfobacter sp. TaxID=240139 RepID=UPI002AABD9A5|nr:NAD(P)-dependent oxidoreductase [uncultured Desulfobacter sp.]